jgi:hypothetical protein
MVAFLYLVLLIPQTVNKTSICGGNVQASSWTYKEPNFTKKIWKLFIKFPKKIVGK